MHGRRNPAADGKKRRNPIYQPSEYSKHERRHYGSSEKMSTRLCVLYIDIGHATFRIRRLRKLFKLGGRCCESVPRGFLTPNRQLGGFMPCYYTDSFRLSHIEKFHILLKSSSKTLILRPFKAIAARSAIAELRCSAAYHCRVPAFRGMLHWRECPEVAVSRRSGAEIHPWLPNGGLRPLAVNRRI